MEYYGSLRLGDGRKCVLRNGTERDGKVYDIYACFCCKQAGRYLITGSIMCMQMDRNTDLIL